MYESGARILTIIMSKRDLRNECKISSLYDGHLLSFMDTSSSNEGLLRPKTRYTRLHQSMMLQYTCINQTVRKLD